MKRQTVRIPQMTITGPRFEGVLRAVAITASQHQQEAGIGDLVDTLKEWSIEAEYLSGLQGGDEYTVSGEGFGGRCFLTEWGGSRIQFAGTGPLEGWQIIFPSRRA